MSKELSDTQTKKKNWFASALIKILPGVVVAVILIGIFLFFRSNLFSHSTNVTNVTLESRFGPISELLTYEQSYAVTKTYEDSKRFFDLFDIPFTHKSVVVVANGKIKVGFELSSVKPELDSENKIVHIDMPAPQVKDNYIEIVTCVEENSIFNPISVDEINNELENEKKQKLDEAMKKGILKKAEENAKKIIDTMYADIVKEGYKLEVSFPETTVQ